MRAREDELVSFEVTKFEATSNRFVAAEKFTSIEIFLDVYLNGEKFSTTFCSPNDVEDLAIGILAQAEKIFSAEDITRLEMKSSRIDIETKSDVAPAQKNFADVKFVAKDLMTCADKLLGELSTTHSKTNGVHSGALFDGKEILIFREDIGRHNVFDKIFGAALRQNIFLGNKALIFSGRCSSEMMIKLRRMNIPVVLAKSVPTTLSINLAKKLGITLAARLAKNSFCIYTNPQRIVLQGGK